MRPTSLGNPRSILAPSGLASQSASGARTTGSSVRWSATAPRSSRQRSPFDRRSGRQCDHPALTIAPRLPARSPGRAVTTAAGRLPCDLHIDPGCRVAARSPHPARPRPRRVASRVPCTSTPPGGPPARSPPLPTRGGVAGRSIRTRPPPRGPMPPFALAPPRLPRPWRTASYSPPTPKAQPRLPRPAGCTPRAVLYAIPATELRLRSSA
jgi:hypothetical protein